MKKWNIFYIILFFAICLVPSLGMLVTDPEVSAENRELASFPSLRTEEGWNSQWLPQAGDYFQEHFAFRNELVTANALLNGKILGVSTAEGVIQGTDNWLYYKDSLEDYQGTNLLSDRSLFNIAHSLSMMQEYLEGKGVKFLFTVAPNKNSLYGEHMPYYYQQKVTEEIRDGSADLWIAFPQDFLEQKANRLKMGMEARHGVIELCTLPERRIILSSPISGKYDEEDFSVAAEFSLRLKKLFHLYDSFGSRISMGAIQQSKFDNYDSFFACCPNTLERYDEILPAGKYLRAFCVGEWGQLPEVYRAILAYVRKHNLTLTGYAYEEGLNEMSIKTQSDYVTMITIRCEE